MSKAGKRSQKVARLMSNETPFAIKEAFNQLRTNLMYTAHDGNGAPIYAISSAEEHVGKSTVLSNLALAFAQAGKKTLLIDADMRRPVLYKFFEYDKKRIGLSEMLSGICEDCDSAITSPIENLHVITSGITPPNPSALIISKKLSTFLEKWKNEYDIIFIDLPPVGIVSDPLAISMLVDGYIFVIMANRSDSKRVSAAITQMKNVNANIVGMVLTATNSHGNGARYGKYGKYLRYAGKYSSYEYYSYDSYYSE